MDEVNLSGLGHISYLRLSTKPLQAGGVNKITKRNAQLRINGGCKQIAYDKGKQKEITKTLKLLSDPKRAPKDGRALHTGNPVEHLANLALGDPDCKRHLSDIACRLIFAIKR